VRVQGRRVAQKSSELASLFSSVGRELRVSAAYNTPKRIDFSMKGKREGNLCTRQNGTGRLTGGSRFIPVGPVFMDGSTQFDLFYQSEFYQGEAMVRTWK